MIKTNLKRENARENLRQQNEKRRHQSQNIDSNDILAGKNSILFLLELLYILKNVEIKSSEQRLSDKQQILFDKFNEKLSISDEEAIKFLNSDEFEKLNKDTFKFDEQDKKQIEAFIKLDNIESLNAETLIRVAEKQEELERQRKEQENTNNFKNRVESATENKIQRNQNRNRQH